jgi:hypothetical protein
MHELTLEQQFSVRSFADTVRGLDREQAIDSLVQLYAQMIRQESTYKNLLRQHWGIEDGPKKC